MTRALAIALVLGLAAPASAHPLDLGYLRIDAGHDELTYVLDLDVAAAAHVLGVEPARIDLRRLAAATIERAPIATELGDCRWGEASGSVAGRTASISGRAACPAGATTLRWPMPFVAEARISPVFQLLVKARVGAGGDVVATLDRDAATLELGTARAHGFRDFVWSGIEHIGAAPNQWRDGDGWKLPDGIDHILFLLALLLAGGTLLQLVGIASGFTLGHSITLALATLGVFRPPPQLIEPLIALSIALVAAEAFLGRSGKRRWKVAACFGLVHGFGFASALVALDLSTRDAVTALFGYNAGVELGQVAIVLAIAPLVLSLQRWPRAHHVVVRCLAAMIFSAGSYWFVERLIG